MKLFPTLLYLALILWACSDDAVHEHEAARKGPHGGRWIEDGDFALEITIFEQGVPPEFRVYTFHDGEPISPDKVGLVIELVRFSGLVERFNFSPRDDYLLGDSVVGEPHSFEVKVQAEHEGEKHAWSYESYEGRTTIPVDVAARSGIETAPAGPGLVREQLTLYGVIRPSPEGQRKVAARFPGIIRSVSKNLGETVRAGETLATVESNESLEAYAVRAPISGVVTGRTANPDEMAGDAALFEITDPSVVVAELTVFPSDRARLRVGLPVRIVASAEENRAEGTVESLTPAGGSASPTWVTRVRLENGEGRWTPGLFVTGELRVSEVEVPIAVPVAAVQTFRGWEVVFLNAGEDYQAQPLELGRRDAESVEVLSGLAPGQVYVVRQSYLVKADIEKSGASHDH